MADVLVQCIPEVAVEAGKIMNWLHDVARILAEKNRVMVWTSATGFIVVHENREPKKVRIVTADHTFVLHEYNEKRKIDKRKQIDGIVANLVHSFDAYDANHPSSSGARHPIISPWCTIASASIMRCRNSATNVERRSSEAFFQP